MRTAAGIRLAREMADAHGADALAAAKRVAVSFSSGGLAFATKGQPDALATVEAQLHPRRQEISLSGRSPRPWTLHIASSAELASRLHAARCGHRRLRWSPEDVGAFAAAAIWTYITLPLLAVDAVGLETRPDVEGRRRLRVTLPSTIAGHSSMQTLHVGPDGLIHRHDYTATTFGSWARAAQVIEANERFDGLVVGTKRRVTPRIARPLASPTLVWIEIRGVRLDGDAAPPTSGTLDSRTSVRHS